MASHSPPFIFRCAESRVLPDPSRFFSPHLLSSPLPTNSFFQNFVLNNGDQPEYIHPYLIKSTPSGISLCYPSRFSTPSFIYQIFDANITVSSLRNNQASPTPHLVTSFSDLGVTLDLLPSSKLSFFLVRGSPFITFSVDAAAVSISTAKISILTFSPNPSRTKFTFTLDNKQTWLIYSSSPINLTHHLKSIVSGVFSGVLRIAFLPASRCNKVLDVCSSRYPISGDARLGIPCSVNYRWETRGDGDLLMLANPLHLQLLSSASRSKLTILDDFKYQSMDGDLVGVIGDIWTMKLNSVPVTWHSIRGIDEDQRAEIVRALTNDVGALSSEPISTTSSYFYGKTIARAARLALIAEEVRLHDVMPALKSFLSAAIEPWLDGTFSGNGFVYDKKWGGILTQQGVADTGADFGFGMYNDHHYHLGYFIYAIAVLAKLDRSWGRRYRPQAYSILADFFTLGRNSSYYTRLRCFDFWKFHSWAGGLTEFADGRNQESTSEAVNAYYAAALLGQAYGDSDLVSVASTVLTMEVHAANTWWHVRKGENIYEAEFTRDNRVVGVMWSTKRDSSLWFAPGEWRECRLGIQVLPLLPVTEVLFEDEEFTRQLVEWASPSLKRDGVGEGWKGFVYALEATYDKQKALEKVWKLRGHDDGNSLSNILWWIHSRDRDGGEEEVEHRRRRGHNLCFFTHYCQ